VKKFGLDLNGLVCNPFFESRHGLLTIPEDLRWAVFEGILRAKFNPDDTIRQNGETYMGRTDDGFPVSNGLEGRDRWERHDFLGFNGMD
jgi:hypothetical protein